VVELTDRQLDVLRAISAWREKHDYAPTIRELGDRLGIDSTNGVQDHLKALRRHELVEWVPRSARTLRLTQRAVDLLTARAA
jgi:repressor LexA